MAYRVVKNDLGVSPRAIALARIPASLLEVEFDEGETMWTESSYKYGPEGIIQALERAGFRRGDQWIDEADGFALTLVEAT